MCGDFCQDSRICFLEMANLLGIAHKIQTTFITSVIYVSILYYLKQKLFNYLVNLLNSDLRL